MCQHERMTLEDEQIRDYVEFFCTSDSSSRVLHLVAEPLPRQVNKRTSRERRKMGVEEQENDRRHSRYTSRYCRSR
jgi:hypothetical protein